MLDQKEKRKLRQKLSQIKDASIPFSTFAGNLSVMEYDFLCPELGTVAGIKPSNYIFYTLQFTTNPVNTSLINTT